MNDTLEINYDGKPRELLMSFGLLNEMMKIVRDIPNVQVIAIDPDIRREVLEGVFSERDAKGRITEQAEINSLPITPATASKVLTWVSEHVLDFFLVAVESAVKTLEPHNERLVKLMPSGLGSEG